MLNPGKQAHKGSLQTILDPEIEGDIIHSLGDDFDGERTSRSIDEDEVQIAAPQQSEQSIETKRLERTLLVWRD